MNAKVAKSVKVIVATALTGFVAFCHLSFVTVVDVKRDNTDRLLTEMQSALSTCQLDYGQYLSFTGPPESGGEFLYAELVLGEKIYLAPDGENKESLFRDGWGNPIRYQCGETEEGRKMKNPTYDLRSVGCRRGTDDESQWIATWQVH